MPKTLDIFTEFEKIDKKMKNSNGHFGLLGRVEILYNPDKDVENINPSLIADHRIGFDNHGDAHIEVIHRQRNFPDAIQMYILEIEEELIGKKLEAMVIPHFKSSFFSGSEFSHEEADNHPFVLSWRCFLQDQTKWLEEENIETMSSGRSYPAFLSVEQGIRLMRGWVDWLNKYSK